MRLAMEKWRRPSTSSTALALPHAFAVELGLGGHVRPLWTTNLAMQLALRMDGWHDQFVGRLRAKMNKPGLMLVGRFDRVIRCRAGHHIKSPIRVRLRTAHQAEAWNAAMMLI